MSSRFLRLRSCLRKAPSPRAEESLCAWGAQRGWDLAVSLDTCLVLRGKLDEPDRVWVTRRGGQNIGLEPGSWVLALASSLIHHVPWVVMVLSASVSSTGKMK